MITAECIIPQSLKRKLKKSWLDNRANNLTTGVANNLLWNVQEYGFGVGNYSLPYPNYDENHHGYSKTNRTPSGGAPIWQGKISETGHYRGYLSESHYIKYVSSNHAQIVSSADFTEGVIRGYSTNWFNTDGEPYYFPPNPYHKRAVDKMYRENVIPTVWKSIRDK